MLHELLLALSGYPGGIFVKRKDGEIEVNWLNASIIAQYTVLISTAELVLTNNMYLILDMF